MKRKYIGFLAFIGLAAVFFGPSPALAQISLGTSQSFAVLGGQTVTNTGATTLNANVGVFPGSAVTGFPPGVVAPPGMIHAGNAVAGQAQTDLTAAYNAIAGTACNLDLTGQNLGGLTLTPGVYCFSSSAFLTGTLRLDFQGNPNALFLFRIGSTLITASGSSVLLLNSGGTTCPQNLFWQVGSDATLGTGSMFLGNILALTSITLTTGARLSGRALARNGSVTLDTNSITACGPLACPVITVNPPILPNGVLGTAYNQTVSGSGGVAPYTFSVTSGALPNGLLLNAATGTITGTPVTTGTFRFSITAADANGCLGSRAYFIAIAAIGCPVISLGPPALPPGNVGTPFNQTLSASGGVAPYTFALLGGTLPNGLTLNATTGAITGTPTTSGIFSFTIGVTDANGCPGSTRAFSITIALARAAVPTLDFVGLMILMLLLAGAGLFAMKRFPV